MEIKNIETEKDYKEALRLIEALWEAPANSKDERTLEALSVVVEEYEGKHYPIGPPDPIEAAKYRMEQIHLSQTDVVAVFAGKSSVPEVLDITSLST